MLACMVSTFLNLFVNPQRKLLQDEEETDEEKQFRAIYKKISGEVSTFWTFFFLLFFFFLNKENQQVTCHSCYSLIRTCRSAPTSSRQSWRTFSANVSRGYSFFSFLPGVVIFIDLFEWVLFCRRRTKDWRVQHWDVSEYDRLDGRILRADFRLHILRMVVQGRRLSSHDQIFSMIGKLITQSA